MVHSIQSFRSRAQRQPIRTSQQVIECGRFSIGTGDEPGDGEPTEGGIGLGLIAAIIIAILVGLSQSG